MITRGEEAGGRRREKRVKRIHWMVRDGNETFGGEPAVVYTEVEILCCTHDTYIIL